MARDGSVLVPSPRGSGEDAPGGGDPARPGGSQAPRGPRDRCSAVAVAARICESKQETERGAAHPIYSPAARLFTGGSP